MQLCMYIAYGNIIKEQADLFLPKGKQVLWGVTSQFSRIHT